MNKRYYSYNRTYPLTHQYGIGDWLQKGSNMMSNAAWSNIKGPVTDAVLGFAGKALNPDGNKTAFSDFGNTVGDLVGMIPGVGTIAKYALKGITALTDAAFGSNVNEAAVQQLGTDLGTAQSNIGSSLSWDTLASNAQDLSDINVAGADLGTQGWLNHDVDNARERLLNRKEAARNAIGYASNNINTLENRMLAGTALANGGGIHIKPSKRGTFTAAATKHGKSVQAFASQVLANPENYSPAMVKKANFARNASKWHENGGPIFKTDYDMGLTFINNGGTHEQNPYGGVFMGIAPDGQPNQVEEGEVIFNDYVYSNRLKVPKAIRSKYKLRETKDWTFADAIEEYIKKNGVEERNNDPIANRGLEAFASELAMEQEMIKAKKEAKQAEQFANGGHLFADGDFIIYDKTYKGYDELYDPNSAYMRSREWLHADENKAERDALIKRIQSGEFGEVPEGRFEDVANNWYTLARDNRKGPVHNALMKYAAEKAEAAANMRALGNLPKVTPDGIVGIRATNRTGNLDDTSAIWNYGANKGGLHYNPGDVLPGSSIEDRIAARKNGTTEEEEDTYDPSYWWRMAGLGANVAGLMANVLDPYYPQVVNTVGPYRTISARPIGDYMVYNPEDINYATSQLDANNAALRNSLMQSTAPGRLGSLLAADFNANTERGTARRQAREYNDALRKTVTDFNRNTNTFNTQMMLDAASKNQSARQAYYENLLRQAQFNSQMDFQHKMAKDQAIGQGLTAIADYLNNIGKDETARAGVDVYQSTMPTGNEATEEYTNLVRGKKSKSKGRR